MYIKAAREVQDLRGKITPTEKAVAFVMSVHASPPPQNAGDGDAGIATMSMSTLARESGLAHRETASDIVKRLVAIGIITPVGAVSKGGGRGGKTRTTAYQFTFTVNPESGVWKTTAAEERAARDAAKVSVTHPANPPADPSENDGQCNPPVALKPENRAECDSPVTLKPQNAKVSVTPQLHEGFTSRSFGEFSDVSASLRRDAASEPLSSPLAAAIRRPAVPPAGPFADPGEHSSLPNSSFYPAERNLVVVDGANAFLNLGKKEMSGQSEQEQRRSEAAVIRKFEKVFEHVQAQDRTLFSERKALRCRLELYDEQVDLGSDAVLRTTPKQCAEIISMCKARGTEAVLTLFEEFLVTVDHKLNSSDDSPYYSHFLREFSKWACRRWSLEMEMGL